MLLVGSIEHNETSSTEVGFYWNVTATASVKLDVVCPPTASLCHSWKCQVEKNVA